MATNNINTTRGFTIIEVVLVLAIAGLIFLMVFIALPNMQRSQRDTQRRNDYAAFSANITGYMTNNNGALPADGNNKLDPAKFINTSGTDPDDNKYEIIVVACGQKEGDSAADGAFNCYGLQYAKAINRNDTPHVYLVKKAKCSVGANGDTIAVSVSGNRSYAILGQLETGVYCQDNQ